MAYQLRSWRVLWLITSALGALSYSSVAAAQDVSSQTDGSSNEFDSPSRITVTPRIEAIYFLPHTNTSFQLMPTVGGTINFQTRSPEWAYDVTGFYGALGAHEPRFGTELSYTARRYDMSAHAEYTPPQSTLTFLTGIRYVHMSVIEQSNPDTGVHSAYSQVGVLLEEGMKVGASFGRRHQHAVSFSALVGVGYAHYAEDTTGTLTPTAHIIAQGVALGAEVADGYNYYFSDHFSIGARLRGFVFKQLERTQPNQFGSHITLGWGPEISASLLF